jgi:hypothetical protein
MVFSKKLRAMIASSLTLGCLGGCAAIFDGTSQEIMVNTSPSGATCTFAREGFPIATVIATPGSALVKKTKNDIMITCKKEGYEDATFLNHSGVAGAAIANVLGGVLTGGVAWAVDSSSGADNKYDSPVNITLSPKPKL